MFRLPAIRIMLPTSRFGWSLWSTALLIGVVNPLVCVLQCVQSSTAHPDDPMWMLLCAGTAPLGGDFAPLPVDGGGSSMTHAPKLAPLFDSYVALAAMLLPLLIIHHAWRDAGWRARQSVAYPPLVPPPQPA